MRTGVAPRGEARNQINFQLPNPPYACSHQLSEAIRNPFEINVEQGTPGVPSRI
jgi:hypothetical protein